MQSPERSNTQPSTNAAEYTKAQEAFVSTFIRLANLAGRQHKPIRRRAEDLYEVICATGRFSWAGLFETTDALQRTRLALYVEERCQPSSDQGEAPTPATFSPEFARLSLALRPVVFLDLYYSHPEAPLAQPARKSGKDLKLRYAADGHKPTARLLWEAHILPASPAC